MNFWEFLENFGNFFHKLPNFFEKFSNFSQKFLRLAITIFPACERVAIFFFFFSRVLFLEDPICWNVVHSNSMRAAWGKCAQVRSQFYYDSGVTWCSNKVRNSKSWWRGERWNKTDAMHCYKANSIVTFQTKATIVDQIIVAQCEHRFLLVNCWSNPIRGSNFCGEHYMLFFFIYLFALNIGGPIGVKLH